MASRLLAVIAAIAMIGGAFVYRYGLPGGDGDAATDRPDGVDRGAVICAAELGPDVCEAAGDDVTFEPAATTADRLVAAASASDAGVAVWITPGPWAQMVDAGRGSRPNLFGRTEVIGSTPLVVVTKKAQPIGACASALTWRCVGDAAQDPNVRLAADPATSPAGLLVRAAALGGFVGSTDFAINDLDDDSAAPGWFANVDRTLDRSVSFGATSVGKFVITPAAAQAYLTTGAAAAVASGRPELAVTAPTPTAVVGASIARAAAGSRGEGAGVDVDRLRRALKVAGWQSEPPPGDDGLPSPGVLFALRGRVG